MPASAATPRCTTCSHPLTKILSAGQKLPTCSACFTRLRCTEYLWGSRVSSKLTFFPRVLDDDCSSSSSSSSSSPSPTPSSSSLNSDNNDNEDEAYHFVAQPPNHQRDGAKAHGLGLVMQGNATTTKKTVVGGLFGWMVDRK